MRRYAVALTVLSVATIGAGACSPSVKEDENAAPTSREPVCQVAESAPGTWTILRQPGEVTGFGGIAAPHNFSDGETFSIVGEGHLGQVLPGVPEWLIAETDRFLGISGRSWAASGDFLLVQGGIRDHTNDTTNSVELLDLASGRWTEIVPPESVPLSPVPAKSFWTGTEFAFWGSYWGAESTGSSAFYSDVVLFDPVSGDWRVLESSLRPFNYEVEDLPGPLSGHLSADWVQSVLFAWGILPDLSDTFGLVFDGDLERWSSIAPEDGPGLRRHHHVVGSDDGFFVVGGIHVDSESKWLYLGEIWHYSLSEDAWTEVDVPDFVDPIRGAWMDGKLYVFGRCDADAVYDPQTDGWELLPSLAVPDWGEPIVAGGRIFLTDVTEPHGDDLLDIFIYDPNGTSGAGGAESE